MNFAPTVDELRLELDAFWHGSACSIGPKAFRARLQGHVRDLLLHCYRQPSVDPYRERREKIAHWLETAALPQEVADYDPTHGWVGSCMGGSGNNGHYIITGDEPCCEMDPAYAWHQAGRKEFLDLVESFRERLTQMGWKVPPVEICADCLRRLREAQL